MTAMGTNDRPDWKADRDRIDLAAVATNLLGPAPERKGERGRKLWWSCPFHDDSNPSFVVEPGSPRWRCWGCGESGDAADLVMRLEGLTFIEAAARLAGQSALSARTRRPVRSTPKPPREEPKGLPLADALALVETSAARLWSADGVEALAYLTNHRYLTLDTIRTARLGWTPGVVLDTKDGRPFAARGWTIPWFDKGRLSLVKIRQPDGVRPKYAEAFRDRPSLFLGAGLIRPGRSLVVTEGEFDALLLGQELADLAAVVTLGSASGRPTPEIRAEMRPAAPWYLATDYDQAGEKAAEGWPARARRVRPPHPYKDWTQCRQDGVDLRRWWTGRLGGLEHRRLFTWRDLAGWHPEPGIAIDMPEPGRRRLALESLGTGPGDACEEVGGVDYDAPAGGITPEDIEELLAHNAELITHPAGSGPPAGRVARPLPWRPVVARWSIEFRQRWGDRANALQDEGISWHEAERVAFDELNAAEPLRLSVPPVSCVVAGAVCPSHGGPNPDATTYSATSGSSGGRGYQQSLALLQVNDLPRNGL